MATFLAVTGRTGIPILAAVWMCLITYVSTLALARLGVRRQASNLRLDEPRSKPTVATSAQEELDVADTHLFAWQLDGLHQMGIGLPHTLSEISPAQRAAIDTRLMATNEALIDQGLDVALTQLHPGLNHKTSTLFEVQHRMPHDGRLILTHPDRSDHEHANLAQDEVALAIPICVLACIDQTQIRVIERRQDHAVGIVALHDLPQVARQAAQFKTVMLSSPFGRPQSIRAVLEHYLRYSNEPQHQRLSAFLELPSST